MLKTEKRNPKTTHIDKMSSLEIVNVMNEESLVCLRAVEAESENIAAAVDAAAGAIMNGGRLIYMGAGTSGRLGVLDASECPPTFGVPSGLVVGLIAGGDARLRSAGEGAEDSGEAGINDLKNIGLCERDMVCGISAAGGAAYVTDALEYAKSLGCVTVGITSNKGSKLDIISDISIAADTGAEVVTGSTRLKAGTAQKLVLNMISTGAMIKCGYVLENLMINLKPSNIKLRKRVISIVCELAEVSEDKAIEALDAAEWEIRRAVETLKA